MPNTQSYSEYTKEFSFPGISDDQIRAMTLVWDSFSSVMSPTRLRSHQTPSSEVEMFTCDVCHKRAQIETLNHYSILALPTVFISQCSFSFESGSVASGQSAISSSILPQSSRMMSSDSPGCRPILPVRKRVNEQGHKQTHANMMNMCGGGAYSP